MRAAEHEPREAPWRSAAGFLNLPCPPLREEEGEKEEEPPHKEEREEERREGGKEKGRVSGWVSERRGGREGRKERTSGEQTGWALGVGVWGEGGVAGCGGGGGVGTHRWRST